MRVITGIFAFIVTTFLFGGGWLLLDGSPSVTATPEATPAPSTSSPAEPEEEEDGESEPDPEPTCSSEDRLAAVLFGMGLDRADVRVDREINWTAVPAGRVATSYNFGGAAGDWSDIETRLTAGGDVTDAFMDALSGTVTASELENADIIGIQLIEPTQLLGNHQRVGSDAKEFPTASETGEVIWVLAPKDCSEQSQIVGVRRVCGNPVIWRKGG